MGRHVVIPFNYYIYQKYFYYILRIPEIRFIRNVVLSYIFLNFISKYLGTPSI